MGRQGDRYQRQVDISGQTHSVSVLHSSLYPGKKKKNVEIHPTSIGINTHICMVRYKLPEQFIFRNTLLRINMVHLRQERYIPNNILIVKEGPHRR